MLVKKLIQAMFPLAMHVDPPGGGGPAAGLTRDPPNPAAALTAPPAGGQPGAAAPADGGGAPGSVVPADAWYKDFKDPGVKEWLASYKGAYPDAEAVATKALNLEKFVGADKAQRGIIIPKPDAKPEEWADFYRKAGAPGKPEEYKLPATLKPEMVEALGKDPMVAKFREMAHKSAMPQAHFQSVMDWYVGEIQQAEQQRLQKFESQAETDMKALETEWGNDHAKNVELARRAVRAFAPTKDPDQLNEFTNKLMGAIGVAATYKLFSNIGKALTEDDFVLGGGTGGDGGMSREAAAARIKELQKDPAFATKIANGDADSKAEWNKLHKIAYGEST